MSTTKIVSYRIMGKLITFSITENKDTNQFTARIQSGGEIVAVIEGDKIKNAFENVKKRLPKFFEEERAINNIGKQFVILRRTPFNLTNFLTHEKIVIYTF